MLMDMLAMEYIDKTYLEIENILCNNDEDIHENTVRDFFEYVSDVILALLSREK